MEFPELGEHCSVRSCSKLDFLPVKCDACDKIFCAEHMSYNQHSCQSAYQKDVQVPICPLCGSPVPTPRNQLPDVTVSEHIDRDCQSDPAKAKRRVNSNKCNYPGCKIKEMIPVICRECKKNFCLRHRYTDEHNCKGKTNTRDSSYPTTSHVSSVQGNMSEDEALARALAESLKEERRPVPRPRDNSQGCEIS